jgi:sugar phosphate permease
MAKSSSVANLRSAQSRVFWLLWGAYASYYLCRVNFAVAQPAILKEFPDWTSAQIGTIPSTYAAVYAIGQIVNGTLGQRYGARRMMTSRLEKPGYQRLAVKAIRGTDSSRWLMQPTLAQQCPGFLANKAQAQARLGTTPASVAASIALWRRFR